jgi:phosphoribosylformimino-5-aminoimidazole carboxamide ribotide isomerase
MEIFPAIDLKSGYAVRLFQGDYDKMTVYSDSPVEVADSFKSAGAKYLHLVDLDGARDGGNPNIDIIGRIVRLSGLQVEIGGGIRGMDAVRRYLDMGIMRVIIGTAAVMNPSFLKQALARYGDKIAVGVDIRGEAVATHGWTKTSGRDCFDFCRELEDMGVKTVICTDISRDGVMAGPNVELYQKLSESFSMDIIASGGVSVIDDIKALDKAGASGAILGKAIYTGGIDLKAALEVTSAAL